MGREVKSVMLILENCEAFEIDRKHIGEFYVSGIERTIQRSACNSISEDFIAKSFNIQIHKDANIKTGWKDTTMFERIENFKDITQLLITYDDGTSENLFVDWISENEYSNDAQKAKVSEVNEALFIVIDENETLESVFEYELNEDDNFTWTMYSE